MLLRLNIEMIRDFSHTSMHAEYLIIDDNTQRKEIKHIRKVVPHIGIAVLPRTFRIKSI
jgi:hypothetical protein